MPLEPVPLNDDLMADIEAADPGHGLVLWWLGQSAFLVKSGAGRVLLNPCVSDTRTHATYPSIAIGELQSIDIVTLNSPHTGCFVAPELAQVFHTNPTAALVVPEVSRKPVAKQLGCDPAWPWGLNNEESVAFGEITVLAVRPSFSEPERDGMSNGDTVGYVVWLNDISVFYCGKMQHHAGTFETLRPLVIDVALVPIHGQRPEHQVAGNLPGDEAARFAHDVGTRLVVPYPGEGGAFDSDCPALFARTCEHLEQPHKILRCGERLVIPAKLRQN